MNLIQHQAELEIRNNIVFDFLLKNELNRTSICYPLFHIKKV